ncbi:hypothetical protein GALMADRAFT_143340 [Galerina marginata CBS 339.88]|uniref:Uncharacterized protein n=1 Tax=Galerina marginata (strain CBS 339.88) TaxID=685588 RepID=A0A067SWE9_GALM3|nr:hypothetical protein GALMADRAFT_143340 [Galerina marginata CBS 339.88]
MQRGAVPPPWGLAVHIPTPANADAKLTPPWNSLPGSFSPLTVYYLRRWQGVFPGIRNFFIECQARFRSADIAWFTSGHNRDGNHIHPQTSFHPSLVTLVKETPSNQAKDERKALLAELKELMFDTATMYDRLTGSTTIIISSGGTTVPGAPTRPEILKASVYLPPAFVAHHPDLHRPIVDIVQHFIETVGVRTVTMWTQRARKDLGYKLTQGGNPNRNAPSTTIPDPEHNSAHYTFLGQPYRISDDPSSASAPTPSPARSSSYGFDDLDNNSLVILDLQQRNYELENQVQALEEHIDELEENAKDAELEVSTLALQCKRADERVQLLEAQTRGPAQHARTLTQPTMLRYSQATPGKSVRAQTPSSYGRPAPQSPESPSRQRIQSTSGTPTIARTAHFGSPSVSYSGHASPSTSRVGGVPQRTAVLSNTDGLASTPTLLLSHYINLFELGSLSPQLHMISTYIPAANRMLELTKLGLDKTLCETLDEGIALDKGEY